MAENWRFALAALGDLTTARGQRFTTAEIARRAGETSRQAGKWTEPWRDSLYALMLAGLVSTPEGRPLTWALTPTGFERTRAEPVPTQGADK